MIFFDTETTGLINNLALPLNQQPRIIEIGAIKDTGEEFHALLDPQIKLDEKITKITGLNNERLLGKPKFRDILDDLIEFFIGEKTLVAHNIPFDRGMLSLELRRMGREFQFPWPPEHIDTVDLAKPRYKGKYMKLQSIYEDMIGPYEQKHRALEDARDLKLVYEALVQ